MKWALSSAFAPAPRPGAAFSCSRSRSLTLVDFLPNDIALFVYRSPLWAPAANEVSPAMARFLNRDRVILECLLGFKRAGASGILTYFARDAAKLLAR